MIEVFIGFVFAWSVIDGDTIKATMRVWPNVMVEEHIRLIKIDTPEVHAKTPCERALAAEATKFTKDKLTAAKKIRTEVALDLQRDGFGRILGDVYVDDVSISELLLANRLARSYNGGTKSTTPWC